ncbi:hypothetical protein, partial [Rhizobium sp. N122]|uniref:hypothetical protein n=1 Tax=Rhizobium sp. N122 TaxID=1764272 RepID=UPI001AECAA1A
FANPEKEVAPSLPASTPAMTLNHKIKGKGISARFRLALTDSSFHSAQVLVGPVSHDPYSSLKAGATLSPFS